MEERAALGQRGAVERCGRASPLLRPDDAVPLLLPYGQLQKPDSRREATTRHFSKVVAWQTVAADTAVADSRRQWIYLDLSQGRSQ